MSKFSRKRTNFKRKQIRSRGGNMFTDAFNVFNPYENVDNEIKEYISKLDRENQYQLPRELQKKHQIEIADKIMNAMSDDTKKHLTKNIKFKPVESNRFGVPSNIFGVSKQVMSDESRANTINTIRNEVNKFNSIKRGNLVSKINELLFSKLVLFKKNMDQEERKNTREVLARNMKIGGKRKTKNKRRSNTKRKTKSKRKQGKTRRR